MQTSQAKNWIGVACRSHVRKGQAGGFCQLGHGKHQPVKRLKPGDRIVYYSPREVTKGGEPLRAFTAIGTVSEREPYLVQMTEDFEAWRRDVVWWDSVDAAIKPLIPRLSFIIDPTRWGYPFRRGSFEVSPEDFAVIARAMGIADVAS